MDLWTIITDNSTLDVQAGNNFWDHLNNQDGTGSGEPYVISAISELQIEVIDTTPLEIVIHEDTLNVNELESGVSVNDTIDSLSISTTNDTLDIDGC